MFLFLFVFLVKKVYILGFENATGSDMYSHLGNVFVSAISNELKDLDVKIVKGKIDIIFIEDIFLKENPDVLIYGIYYLKEDKITVSSNLICSEKFSGLKISKKLRVCDSTRIIMTTGVVSEAKYHLSKIVRFQISSVVEGEKEELPLKDIGLEAGKSPMLEKIEVAKISNSFFQRALLSKDPKEKLENYAKSIFFWPDFWAPWLGIALLMEDKKRQIFFLLRAIERCPEGRKECEDIKNKILEIFGKEKINALKYYIEAVKLSDFSKEEINLLEQSIASDDKFFPSYYRLGQIYYTLGKFKLSVEKFKKYLETSFEPKDIKKKTEFIVNYLEDLYEKKK